MGIAIISSYPPRKCGIAEYTHDLRMALIASGESYVPIIALEKNPDMYAVRKSFIELCRIEYRITSTLQR